MQYLRDNLGKREGFVKSWNYLFISGIILFIYENLSRDLPRRWKAWKYNFCCKSKPTFKWFFNTLNILKSTKHSEKCLQSKTGTDVRKVFSKNIPELPKTYAR